MCEVISPCALLTLLVALAAHARVSQADGGSAPFPKHMPPSKGTKSQVASAGQVKQYVGAVDKLPDLQEALVSCSFQKEIIMISTTGNNVDSAAQTMWMLGRFDISHVLLVTMSEADCLNITRVLEGMCCVWTTPTLPKEGFQGARRLLHIRLRIAARVIRLGYNTMFLDTDLIIFEDPYKFFKSEPLASKNLMFAGSSMEANIGVMYIQNVAPDGPVAWMFADVVDRLLRWTENMDHITTKAWPTLDNLQHLLWDQSNFGDTLISTLVGRPLFGAAWVFHSGEFNHTWHQMHSKMVDGNMRSSLVALPPDIGRLFNNASSMSLKWAHLHRPFSNRTWPHFLGGPPFPPTRGNYSTAFLDELNLPGVPIWPDSDQPLPPGCNSSFATKWNLETRTWGANVAPERKLLGSYPYERKLLGSYPLQEDPAAREPSGSYSSQAASQAACQCRLTWPWQPWLERGTLEQLHLHEGILRESCAVTDGCTNIGPDSISEESKLDASVSIQPGSVDAGSEGGKVDASKTRGGRVDASSEGGDVEDGSTHSFVGLTHLVAASVSAKDKVDVSTTAQGGSTDQGNKVEDGSTHSSVGLTHLGSASVIADDKVDASTTALGGSVDKGTERGSMDASITGAGGKVDDTMHDLGRALKSARDLVQSSAEEQRSPMCGPVETCAFLDSHMVASWLYRRHSPKDWDYRNPDPLIAIGHMLYLHNEKRIYKNALKMTYGWYNWELADRVNVGQVYHASTQETPVPLVLSPTPELVKAMANMSAEMFLETLHHLLAAARSVDRAVAWPAFPCDAVAHILEEKKKSSRHHSSSNVPFTIHDSPNYCLWSDFMTPGCLDLGVGLLPPEFYHFLSTLPSDSSLPSATNTVAYIAFALNGTNTVQVVGLNRRSLRRRYMSTPGLAGGPERAARSSTVPRSAASAFTQTDRLDGSSLNGEGLAQQGGGLAHGRGLLNPSADAPKPMPCTVEEFKGAVQKLRGVVAPGSSAARGPALVYVHHIPMLKDVAQHPKLSQDILDVKQRYCEATEWWETTGTRTEKLRRHPKQGRANN